MILFQKFWMYNFKEGWNLRKNIFSLKLNDPIVYITLIVAVGLVLVLVLREIIFSRSDLYFDKGTKKWDNWLSS